MEDEIILPADSDSDKEDERKSEIKGNVAKMKGENHVGSESENEEGVEENAIVGGQRVEEEEEIDSQKILKFEGHFYVDTNTMALIQDTTQNSMKIKMISY